MEKRKFTFEVAVQLVCITSVAAFITYQIGYQIGKYKTHKENQQLSTGIQAGQ
jgi:hypothetical protein